MKKLFLLTILCGLFFFAANSSTRPEYWEYTAVAFVYDHEDNPMSGIKVYLSVCAHDGEENLSGYAYGYTNQYGYVVVTYYIDGEYDPELDFMRSYVYNPPYSTMDATGDYTTSSSSIYPEFWIAIDLDNDDVPDVVEEEIAEKFKPVLHKHSYDLSQGLANFEKHLIDGKFTLKVYNDIAQLLYNQVVSGSETALHKWETWHWDTYGAGSVSNEVYNLDLNNSVRYSSAPVDQRPLYYHVYNEGSYYYVQYWYYFGMNDISDQSGTWHESDWEHVSIRLIKNGSVFTPNKINFYLHEGGMTKSASNCWWSSSNSLTYSGIQQGYDENHTHLHIWLAANSHASYNRNSLVYKAVFTMFALGPIKTYVDRVDYDQSGYDLYFQYDYLEKLGEVTKEILVECPDSGYSLEFHSYPCGSGSKHWLAYRGKLGDFLHSGSPFMPAKNPPNPSHEWWSFTNSSNFGNTDQWEFVYSMYIYWITDNGIGD